MTKLYSEGGAPGGMPGAGGPPPPNGGDEGPTVEEVD
jgi:heat shock protein 1/8